FLYLKKHYGLLNALFTESILRINKISFILLFILLASLFLRIVNLNISMPFIGDQGWFYLSARDMLIEGKIPLVGITSSHTWLHQGPLWTYMLSVALLLGNFNPISGGILTAIFGVGTTFLMYKLGSEMFSKRIGIIACFLYAVSPLIVFFERMPFDPSVVPFFTILYFYFVFKWVKGDRKFFPLILFFLALLYNLELATFILFFPFILILVYGFIKRRDFAIKLLNLKYLFYSLIFLTVPMIPVLIYDFSNGFKQTIVFLGWVIYKPFSFLLNSQQANNLESGSSVINFILLNIQRIVFYPNEIISLLLFLSAFAYLAYSVYKEKNIFLNTNTLLLLFIVISLFGIILNKTPSDAYLPIIFPFVIYIIAIFFDQLLNLRRIKYIVVVTIFILFSVNFYSAYQNTLKPDYQNRIKAADEIIALTKGREYNLVGKGEGSWFESFTMNYEYLLWWKGYPPSDEKVKLKIIIKEEKTGISVYKL
ncbi:MAG: glycosyltransferase family 39 protein, partial [Patescibacteria group bacterium]